VFCIKQEYILRNQKKKKIKKESKDKKSTK